MQNRLSKLAEKSIPADSAWFVPFMTAGYPDAETSIEVFKSLAESGADIIEIGMPFSDPLADGGAIQASSTRALAGGMTTGGIFDIVRRFRKEHETPLVLMGYFNPILRRGTSRFLDECIEYGVDGLIIPDLTYDEGDEFINEARRGGISVIQLVAPNSPDDRIKHITQRSDDFIYCVSRYGVTGMKSSLPSGLTDYIARVRELSGLKLLVGFGVGTPALAANLAPYADGVVVGSALVKLVGESGGSAAEAAAGFAASMKKAVTAGEA